MFSLSRSLRPCYRGPVFNDILTGKASLEPKPEAESPYRKAAELPPVNHNCLACGASYQGPAGSVAGRCPTCYVAMVTTNEAESNRIRGEALLGAEKSKRSMRIVKLTLFAGFAIAGGIMKAQMRDQVRDNKAQAAGYRDYADYNAQQSAPGPNDELSQEIHWVVNEACGCQDAMCVRDKDVKLRRLMRDGSPSDDRSAESVRTDLSHFADCTANIH